jgi:hypothetical protein
LNYHNVAVAVVVAVEVSTRAMAVANAAAVAVAIVVDLVAVDTVVDLAVAVDTVADLAVVDLAAAEAVMVAVEAATAVAIEVLAREQLQVANVQVLAVEHLAKEAHHLLNVLQAVDTAGLILADLAETAIATTRVGVVPEGARKNQVTIKLLVAKK